jgi:hypothetical protein
LNRDGLAKPGSELPATPNSAATGSQCVMDYCPNTFFKNARTSACAFFVAASL